MLFFDKLLFRPHLAPGESLLFVAHKHWIEILKISFQITFFGFAIPWLLWAFFPNFFWIAVVWSSIATIVYFLEIADWYFDAWLVTNISIIDVEWKSIFHHLSSRVDFNDIKEIAWEVKGFWGTVLGFGDMMMNLTVGSQIGLENVNSPKKVELMIHKIRSQVLNEQKMSTADTLQEILADIVKNHISEHGIPQKK